MNSVYTGPAVCGRGFMVCWFVNEFAVGIPIREQQIMFNDA